MKARAERRERGPRRLRIELDRVWIARIALLVVVACGLALFAHVSSRMLATGGKRVERLEQAGDAVPSAPATSPEVGAPP